MTASSNKYEIMGYRWDLTGTIQLDKGLFSPEKLGIRWSLEGFGIQKIEFIVRCASRTEAYRRYREHLGHYIVFTSNLYTTVVGGWVYEVELLDGQRVMYTLKGAPRRLKDQIIRTSFDEGDGLATVVQDLMTLADSDIINSTTDWLGSNTVPSGGWNTQSPQGNTMFDTLQQIMSKRNHQGKKMDFWLLGTRVDFMGSSANRFSAPTAHTPYYQARDTTNVFRIFEVPTSMMRSITLSRNINKIATDVRVFYGTYYFTHTGPTRGQDDSGTTSGASANLVDVTAQFEREGVRRGDRVLNSTKSKSGTVKSVVSATEIELDEDGLGSDNDTFGSGDSYTIYRRSYHGQATGGSSVALQDSGETFTSRGFLPGSQVVNVTDGSESTVARITSNTQVNLQQPLEGGTADTFANNDYYWIAQPPALFSEGVDFQGLGVKPGDQVTNITDGSKGTVAAVSGSWVTVDDLTGGTRNRIATNDVVAIQTQELNYSYHDTITPAYWDVDEVYTFPEMSEAQAEDFAAQVIVQDPQQVQAFTISSPWIRNTKGSYWPLFNMIATGGGYVIVPDLYPEEYGILETKGGIDEDSLDGKVFFRITTLDYDHSSRTMRIGVDTPDSRIDTALIAAGILSDEMVGRQATIAIDPSTGVPVGDPLPRQGAGGFPIDRDSVYRT